MHKSSSSANSLLADARKLRVNKQQLNKKKTENKLAEFMNASVTDSEVGIIPEGYGGITYLTFFIFLPEIAGILFMFFYISHGELDAYNTLDIDYLLTWVIGYEIVAAITLLLIFKKAMTFVFAK